MRSVTLEVVVVVDDDRSVVATANEVALALVEKKFYDMSVTVIREVTLDAGTRM